MKITVRQLRRIISEEISSLVEAPGSPSLVDYLITNLQNKVTNSGLGHVLPIDIFNDLSLHINDGSSREAVVKYFEERSALGYAAGPLFDEWDSAYGSSSSRRRRIY